MNSKQSKTTEMPLTEQQQQQLEQEQWKQLYSPQRRCECIVPFKRLMENRSDRSTILHAKNHDQQKKMGKTEEPTGFYQKSRGITVINRLNSEQGSSITDTQEKESSQGQQRLLIQPRNHDQTNEENGCWSDFTAAKKRNNNVKSFIKMSNVIGDDDILILDRNQKKTGDWFKNNLCFCDENAGQSAASIDLLLTDKTSKSVSTPMTPRLPDHPVADDQLDVEQSNDSPKRKMINGFQRKNKTLFTLDDFSLTFNNFTQQSEVTPTMTTTTPPNTIIEVGSIIQQTERLVTLGVSSSMIGKNSVQEESRKDQMIKWDSEQIIKKLHSKQGMGANGRSSSRHHTQLSPSFLLSNPSSIFGLIPSVSRSSFGHLPPLPPSSSYLLQKQKSIHKKSCSSEESNPLKLSKRSFENEVIPDNSEQKTKAAVLTYVDKNFPCDISSILGGGGSTAFIENVNVSAFVWKRSHEIYKQNLEEASFHVMMLPLDPTGLCIGSLGAVYFASALSALIEHHEQNVARVFPVKNTNPDGCYQLNLCWKGLWTIVIVDDSFPVIPLLKEHADKGSHNTNMSSHDDSVRLASNEIASRSDQQQPQQQQWSIPQQPSSLSVIMSSLHENTGQAIWPMLAHKAWAKLHGSYVQVEQGCVADVLHDFLGAPYRKFLLYEKGPDQSIWELITSAAINKHIMITQEDKDQTITQAQRDIKWIYGIDNRHPYTVLGTIQVKRDNEEYYFVKLRNPFCKTEWEQESSSYQASTTSLRLPSNRNNNNNSDGDEMFLKCVPSWVWQELNYRGRQKGSGFFLMLFADFMLFFSELVISYSFLGYEYVGESVICERGESKYLSVEITHSGKYYFSVSQKSSRTLSRNDQQILGNNRIDSFYSQIYLQVAQQISSSQSLQPFIAVKGRKRDLTSNIYLSNPMHITHGVYVVCVRAEWVSSGFDSCGFGVYGEHIVKITPIIDSSNLMYGKNRYPSIADNEWECI